MLNSGKVVAIDSGASIGSDARVQLARLPAALHRLREKNLQLLQPLLRGLFEAADDALFKLADQSENNQEQNLYFDSMREFRIQRRDIGKLFAANLDRAFVPLLRGAVVVEREVSPVKISIDDLSLVQNDELEELVAVDAMVSKACAAFSESLQHLVLRLDNQLPAKVYTGNNPLSPRVICEAFTALLENIAIDIKAKLVVLKLFDRSVMVHLGGVYNALNQLLVEHDILPSLKQDLQQQSQAQKMKMRAAAQVAVQSASATTTVAQSVDSAVLDKLRDLLPTNSAAEGLESVDALDGGTQLLAALSELQASEAAGSNPVDLAHVGVPADLRALSLQLMQSQSSVAAIGRVEGDVINLVNMLFEFILDDRNLAAPMKALLARLQIPILKVAIADKSFFGRGGHPARRLMNEMATAALGWQEQNEKEDCSIERRRSDRLYSKVESIVEKILSNYDEDASLFSGLLTDFLSFREKEQRRSNILEQRTIDAEDGKARSELARAQVDEALLELYNGIDTPLPDIAKALLANAWGNVLLLDALQQGEGSELWNEHLQTGRDLVWSLTAEQTKENRYKLLKLAPSLLKRLRLGLESISFNPFEMSQLFERLEKAHFARLKPQSKTNVTAAPNTTGTDAVAQVPPVLSQTASPLEQEKRRVPISTSTDIQSPDVTAARLKTTVPASKLEKSAQPAAIQPDPQPVSQSASHVASKSMPRSASSSIRNAAVEVKVAAAESASQLADDDSYLLQVDRLNQGSWFEMKVEGGQDYRCRLAAIIRAVDKYIFVNRAGMKVAEQDRMSLAYALKEGRLRLLDDSMLFDRALENVIGSLRQGRGLAR